MTNGKFTFSKNIQSPYFKLQGTGANFRLVPVVVVIGFFLRLFLYLQKDSLWIDEVYLSSSVVQYTWHDLLTKPLLYYQKAPLGLLILQKLMVTLFGANEMSLRFISFICGSATLFVLLPVFDYFLAKRFTWLAIALVALAPPLIFHSCEAKQYAAELLAASIALSQYVRLQNKTDRKNILIATLTGVILVWFSYSVIFILVAIAVALLVQAIYAKDRRQFVFYCILAVLWAFSFLINFYLFTYKHAESKWTVYWFDYFKHFAPMPPKNTSDLAWYLLRFYRMFDYPLGLLWNFRISDQNKLGPILKMGLLPFVLLFLGLVSFWKRKTDFLLLGMAVFLTLLASGLKLYPLTDRFWVFLAPVFIVFIVGGCGAAISKIKILRILLPLVLLIGPLSGIAQLLMCPDNSITDKKSAQRQALSFVEQKYKQGDVVYIYWNDRPGYRLYRQLYPFTFPATEGKDFRATTGNFNEYMTKLKEDMNAAMAKRVWFVINYQFQTDIGEPIDWPSWYFAGKAKPTDRVLEELTKGRKMTVQFKKLDMAVYCLEIK